MSKLIHTDPVLSRLMEALREGFKRKGISRKGDMADYLGYKGPYFSSVINGRERLTSAFLDNVEKKLGVNTSWVLDGIGDVLYPLHITSAEKQWLVPLLPLYAHGGSLTNFDPPVDAEACMEYLSSPIRDAQYAITVSGDSMAPDYPNGSIVLIKKIEESAFIEWGKAYVVDTCNGVVIKILTPGATDATIRCLSINPDPRYAPFEINKEDIYGIFAIRFSMIRR